MKYLILCLISALLLSVSWPTYGIPFFIFFALVPLLMAEHEITKFSNYKSKSLIVLGLAYLTFIVWNILTTGWLYGARNPDGSHSLLAVVFPVLVNAFLYTIVFMLYHWYKRIQGTYWGLVFIVAIWMAFEKFHLGWELTWPWLNLGNAFSEYPRLIQWYDTFGATGGSFWILLVNVYAFYTLRIWGAGRKRRSLVINSSILVGLITVPMLISVIKYNQFDAKPIGEVNVLMLQPDLDPYNEKYQKDSLQILSDLLTLAEKNSTTKIDYYIAPETAIPGKGSISETGLEKSVLVDEIRNFLAKQPQSVFTTGASTHHIYHNENELPKDAYSLGPNVWAESYNASLQIASGEKTQVYHKGKLVPGVEIFPYIKVLKPILGDAMLDLGGTVVSLGASDKRVVFKHPNNAGKLAPIICYESIYGEYVTEYVKNGANFLAIMTNDSWWGVSQGHQQLMSYARLRAIETRREIARAANSGISAHIDAKGEVIEDTFYGDTTTLFAKVKLYEDQTFYTRTGDVLTRICYFILGFLIFYTLIKQIQKRTGKQ